MMLAPPFHCERQGDAGIKWFQLQHHKCSISSIKLIRLSNFEHFLWCSQCQDHYCELGLTDCNHCLPEHMYLLFSGWRWYHHCTAAAALGWRSDMPADANTQHSFTVSLIYTMYMHVTQSHLSQVCAYYQTTGMCICNYLHMVIKKNKAFFQAQSPGLRNTSTSTLTFELLLPCIELLLFAFIKIGEPGIYLEEAFNRWNMVTASKWHTDKIIMYM